MTFNGSELTVPENGASAATPVSGNDYAVTLNADSAAVGEIIEDAKTSYGYAIIHFGA